MMSQISKNGWRHKKEPDGRHFVKKLLFWGFGSDKNGLQNNKIKR